MDLPGIKPRTLNKNVLKIKKNEIVGFYYKITNPKILKNIQKIKLTKNLPKLKKRKTFQFLMESIYLKLLVMEKLYNW